MDSTNEVPATPPREAAEALKARDEMYRREKDFSDTGRANTLFELVGPTLRYVAERRQWLVWRDGRWTVDTHETFVREQALRVAKRCLDQARVALANQNAARAKALNDEARKCRDSGALDRMTRELALKVGVPISVADLDTNPWLLGVENGVVDLKTGELRTHESAADFVTKRCAVAYDAHAKAPRWEQFIAEVTGCPLPPGSGAVGAFRPRPELSRYLQKAIGYMATGSTREHKLFIAIGEGSNGKSQLFEAVARVLGAYSATMPAEALMAHAGADAERATPMSAALAGARFVLASEAKDGQKLDAGAIKNMTGDSRMTARALYQAPVTFTITHKTVLLTNLRPALDHLDAAVRGRLHLIPFDRRWNRPGDIERDDSLPDGDALLAETLKGEAAGILAWIVRGAVLYAQEGLTPPTEVTALTRDYLMQQDHLARWIAEQCQRCSAKDGLLTAELFTLFNTWIYQQGIEPPHKSPQAFGMGLDRLQVESIRTMHGARRGLQESLG